jgi:uncharacterized protein
MPPTTPARAHVIAGGFPPGQPAGHDHDYARLRILQALYDAGIPASVDNDYGNTPAWLTRSRLLITYTAGPHADDNTAAAIRRWVEEGGRWLGLHGSSGGRAARVSESDPRRKMVKLDHHDVLGGFFLSHPPVRRFNAEVVDDAGVLTKDLPQSFEVIDEPYMIEVLHPETTKVFLTSPLGPDPLPGKFGFVYDKDTALMPDGKTRALGFTRPVGQGGVTYIALGHCHTPTTNSQPFVDKNVDPEGKTPGTLRQTWETVGFTRLLHNAIEWGMGA